MMQNRQNLCQALFSRGIAFRKSLIVRSETRFAKSAFGKMMMCENFAHVLLQLGGLMQTEHLQQKSGGRITAIHSVGHSTYKGVADWFYRGDVEWRDGGKSVETEIPPWAVCFDHDNEAAQAEYATVAEALNQYLADQGKWHKPKAMKDGRMVSWTPHKKEFSLAL